MAQEKLFNWYGGNAPAIHGMKADATLDTVDSYAAEGKVNAGDPVVLGTNPAEQVKTATAAQGVTVIGIALFIHVDPSQVATYPNGKSVSVMTSGDVYVEVGTDVTAGGAVALGTVSNKLAYVASTESGATEIPNATYLDSGVAGDLVRIRIRN